MSPLHDDCYLNTDKRCKWSPTSYCKHRGNLAECIHTKTCIVPKNESDEEFPK